MRPAPKRGALPTALWLLRSGLWPVAISARADAGAGSPGKSPLGKAWGVRKSTREDLVRKYGAHPGAGIGLALGPTAGVVDLEVDNPETAGPLLARINPGETLGWKSARGEHRIFAWTDRLQQLTEKAVVYLAGGAVELRLGAAGKQIASVCPPTVGTDRRRRRWNGVWEIAPFPEALFSEIEREQIRNNPVHDSPRPINGPAVPYASAALRDESKRVREAESGTRNRTLNRAAFSLGQLVVAGLLTREMVENELAIAAESAGLSPREIAATIRSGIEAGMKNPRKRLPAG